MVQRIVTLYTDDISGEQGDGIVTHRFSVDGVGYEIDLGHDNYDAFLEALAPYMKAGRRSGIARAPKPVGSGRQRPADGPDPRQVRQWAKARGITVNERGRVPRRVMEQYQAAS